jgi:hypothetical protein
MLRLVLAPPNSPNRIPNSFAALLSAKQQP